jgi:hypothetical protein
MKLKPDFNVQGYDGLSPLHCTIRGSLISAWFNAMENFKSVL